MCFIAVIGKSGAGKTLIINALINKYPKEYRRAKSFTTRAPRCPDEKEYTFVTEEQMQKMLDERKIKYIDEAFGKLYAMDGSIFDDSNLNYIKEIHPNNISKIKQYAKHIITVKVESKDTDDDRNRIDNYDYSAFKADIVIYNSKAYTIELLAKDLHRKIEAQKLHIKMGLPAFYEIDAVNKAGYDKVAACFIDEKRITTANFHDASAEFFIKESHQIKLDDIILELGSGNGWLAELLKIDAPSIDISGEMNGGPLKRIASASLIPALSCTYDIIIASLCDPFFYPAAIAEMMRVLRVNGRVVLSIPSYDWSIINRNNEIKTKFICDNGYIAEVYSFIYSYSQIVSIGEKLGFAVKTYKSYPLKNVNSKVSSAIIDPCIKHKCDYKALNIVDCYVLTKE